MFQFLMNLTFLSASVNLLSVVSAFTSLCVPADPPCICLTTHQVCMKNPASKASAVREQSQATLDLRSASLQEQLTFSLDTY